MKRANVVVFFSIVLLVLGAAVALVWGVGSRSVPPVDKPSMATHPEPAAPATKPTTPSTAEPTPRPTPKPIPANFIVADKYWANAFILQTADGKQGGVGFAEISAGASIYAPIDGYVRVFDAKLKDGSPIEYFIITQEREWEYPGRPDQRSFLVMAMGLDLIIAGKAQKGQAFAEVRKVAEMSREFYGRRVVFLVSLDRGWVGMIDAAMVDPKEFLWAAVQILTRK